MCKDKQTGGNDIEYQIDKYVFIVSPVYNEDSGKNIHQIMLDLMKNEVVKSQNSL